MIKKAKARLGPDAANVRFETRAMHDLDDFAGRFDVAVAVNSLVMPDVREIDRTLSAIHASAQARRASSSASCRRSTRSIIIRCS